MLPLKSTVAAVADAGGGHPHTKHAPYVYAVEALRRVNVLFEAELERTMQNRFRGGDDVVNSAFPLLLPL
eukprot:SAG11_NODE_16970_length_532_cov_1.242494_1_plen_69_part_10